jgi:Transposase IS116/IS110/IS902 family
MRALKSAHRYKAHPVRIFGICPAVAARILADVGDVARFPDRAHFASWAGAAPTSSRILLVGRLVIVALRSVSAGLPRGRPCGGFTHYGVTSRSIPFHSRATSIPAPQSRSEDGRQGFGFHAGTAICRRAGAQQRSRGHVLYCRGGRLRSPGSATLRILLGHQRIVRFRT